ncbi:MAG: hypothetical protein ACRD2X_01720 [Vicinamibacteraceae bacterium]
MLAFGGGAAIPLLAIAYGSRRILGHGSGILRVAATSRSLLGGTLAAVSVAILFGLDKTLETILLDWLPTWWVDAITRL